MAMLVIYAGLVLGLILNTIFGLIPLLSSSTNQTQRSVMLILVLTVYSSLGTCMLFLLKSRKRKR